jgi:chemotaxis protein MotA
MSSSGLAYILSLIYLATAMIWTSPDKPLQFIDSHGAFIVFVGFGVIAVIAVPWQYIKRFFAMIKVVSRRQKDDTPQVLLQIVEVAEKSRSSIQKAKPVLEKVQDLFLKDAVNLLIEGYEHDEIERILRRQIEVQKEREATDAKMFKNLGKYPPACGLIGTVMGMIALLGTLGQEGSESKVGPAMSVALAATLYGVILANLIILPVADNLLFSGQKQIAKRQMIIEGILMIKNKESPLMIKQILLAHLAPHQREAITKLAK